MADVLKRLYGPVSITAASVTVYTAGAGVTTAVRNIHIANTTANPVTFNMAITGSSATATNCLYYQYTVPANGAFDWSGLLVLAPGDYITVLASTAAVMTLTMSGVESS